MKRAAGAGAAIRATALLTAAAAPIAALSPSPSSAALLLAIAFVPYGWLVSQNDPAPGDVSPWADWQLSLRWAALAGAALLCAPPLFSDDVYRYLWDGRVLRHGLNPYALAPSAPALAHLRDGLWARVNHPDIPTLYPPVAQLAFGLLDALWHGPIIMKLASLVTHLMTAWTLGRRGFTRAACLLALNPLALAETAMNGHVDSAVGAALVMAALTVGRGRGTAAALWVGLASGLKLIGLAVAPLIGARRRWLAPVALLVALLPLAPMALGAPQEASGLDHYARRWRGNDGGFTLLRAGWQRLLEDAATPEDRARGHFSLPQYETWLKRSAGTPLDPFRAVATEKKEVPDRSDFELGFLADLLARISAAALAAALVAGLWVRGSPPILAARTTLLAVLLLSPQVHPWYLLWLLPIECVYGGLAGMLWSAIALAAYAPLDLWQSARIWNESDSIRIVEFGTVMLVLIAEPWLLRGRATVGESPTHTPAGGPEARNHGTMRMPKPDLG